MDNSKSAGSVSSRITGARRQPPIQLDERTTGSYPLLLIIPRITDVLVDNAVSVKVRQVTYVTVPCPVMPCQPY